MELFKLVGQMVIEGVDKAKSELSSVSDEAKDTANAVDSSNRQIGDSNTTLGSSWKNLRSSVEQYKKDGMSTSEAWRKATQDMKTNAKDMGDGTYNSFAKIGTAIGAFLVVDRVVAFGKGCIQAASDVQATEAQFTQVFGELEKQASSGLSKIATNAGISENRLKNSYTKIAAFAKTTGADTATAMNISERAMVAVADSAAFYDRSIEDVTESLQSFLKGNYENDAALGLSCTETTRNAAANKLFGKSFKELSEEQKQLTLLQMVEDANKASGALGQAARESETWTNVMGNLKQSWKDFQAVLGSIVLPKVVGLVNNLAGGMMNLVEKMKSAVEWGKEHETTMKVIGIAIATLGTAIGAYALYVNAATIAQKLYTAAMWLSTTAASAFGTVMAFITSPITLTILAIGALVAAVVVMYNKFDWFKNIVNTVKDALVNSWNTIKDKVTGAIDTLKERLEPLVTAIKVNLMGAVQDIRARINGFKDALMDLKEKFQPVIDIIGGAFSKVTDGASGIFDKLVDKVGDFAENVLSKLNERISAAREAFGKIADKAGQFWKSLDPLVTLIRDNLVKALKNLEEPLGKVWDAFKMVGDTVKNDLLPVLKENLMPLWDAMKPVLGVIAGLLGGAVAVAFGYLSGLINGVVSAISGVVDAFSGFVTIISNVFKLIVGIVTGDGEAIKEAVKGIIDGVKTYFGGLWNAVKGFVKGFVDGVVKFFKGLWDTLVGHSIVPDIISGIVNCFAGLWGKVKSYVSDFVSNIVGKFTDIKTKISGIIDGVKTKVQTGVQAIKDGFNFNWSIPKPKMPKFKVSGGKAPWGVGGKGSMPKLSIEWFRKAMNNPMVMNEPTIFGYNQSTGKFMAGGEAGSEVVAGTNTLMNMIQAAVAEQNEATSYYLQKIVAILADYFPQLLDGMDRPICFDAERGAAAMAVPMNKYLGILQAQKDRGR